MLVIIILISISSSGGITYVSEAYWALQGWGNWRARWWVCMGLVEEGLENQVRQFEVG